MFRGENQAVSARRGSRLPLSSLICQRREHQLWVCDRAAWVQKQGALSQLPSARVPYSLMREPDHKSCSEAQRQSFVQGMNCPAAPPQKGRQHPQKKFGFYGVFLVGWEEHLEG